MCIRDRSYLQHCSETDNALQGLDHFRKQIRLWNFPKSRHRMKVPDVRRNLVPDTWTADGEGALPELIPCPHDNSYVGCTGTELATSRFFGVEFDDVAEICRWPALMKNGVHHGNDFKLSVYVVQQVQNKSKQVEFGSNGLRALVGKQETKAGFPANTTNVRNVRIASYSQ